VAKRAAEAARTKRPQTRRRCGRGRFLIFIQPPKEKEVGPPGISVNAGTVPNRKQICQ
jgi:hypothetical protein